MCFSPEASFAGGLIIIGIGIATATRVPSPSQLIFASIPLFFGLQQLAEGALWLILEHPPYDQAGKISTAIFLIMAEVIWPVMIPISVLLMEEKKGRRKALWILLAIGVLISVYYGSCLLFFHVTPRINGSHIKYYNDFPKYFADAAFVLYVVATITPLFVSSIKRTHLLGALMFLSCLVTAIFYTQYLTSVWCFFAAAISIVIYWILHDSKRRARTYTSPRYATGKGRS